MRWVETDTADGTFDEARKPFEAKRRLVVNGFRAERLGLYRRDAPMASRLAEPMLLALTAATNMILERVLLW